MKVFKFGGASVSTVDRIKNVAHILSTYQGQQILVVVSAMGKTTNALEKVSEAFFKKEKDKALELFEGIKNDHLQMVKDLHTTESNLLEAARLNDFFTEIEWLLHDNPVKDYNYYYDQIVCIGEILSSSIVSAYLNTAGINNVWVDVRDIIRTDDNFRDAKIDWQVTGDKVQSSILPVFNQTNLIITQGFIGSTDENESTTLGREGSDYTAAVFANLLDAEGQTIWKDVQGVLNADPKAYEKAQWIKELNYREVIEMAYYGAQVIHPKTIKPLQNKNIPLYVKSFLDPTAEGTTIHHKVINNLPPIIVYKNNQVLVQLTSKDYSFVSEGLTAEMNGFFKSLKFKPNLTQNAAISLLYVVDDNPNKVEQLAFKASELFDVSITRNLCLLTIRHYNDAIIDELVKAKKTLLKQQTEEIIQVLTEA